MEICVRAVCPSAGEKRKRWAYYRLKGQNTDPILRPRRSSHGMKAAGQSIKRQFSPSTKVFFRVKCILLGLLFQVGYTLKEDFPDLWRIIQHVRFSLLCRCRNTFHNKGRSHWNQWERPHIFSCLPILFWLLFKLFCYPCFAFSYLGDSDYEK